MTRISRTGQAQDRSSPALGCQGHSPKTPYKLTVHKGQGQTHGQLKSGGAGPLSTSASIGDLSLSLCLCLSYFTLHAILDLFKVYPPVVFIYSQLCNRCPQSKLVYFIITTKQNRKNIPMLSHSLCSLSGPWGSCFSTFCLSRPTYSLCFV